MFRKLFIFLLYLIGDALCNDQLCPRQCECKKSNAQKVSMDMLKLKCGDIEKINDVNEIDYVNIASDIIQLNLSDNALSTFNPKFQMIALQKLDLSKNKIKYLTNNQFFEVPNLTKLDLSQNLIGEIDVQAFNNLKKLERLKLNQNHISFIVDGTFDPLIDLKQVELSGNPLHCDCNTLWLLNWSQKTSVKLGSAPKCGSPQSLRGVPLRKIKPSLDKDCPESHRYGEISLVVLQPSRKQIVFSGDSLTLQCTGPVIIDSEESSIISRIEWAFEDDALQFDDLETKHELLSSSDLMVSTLNIPTLNGNHSGSWNCVYLTANRNYSKSVDVYVITNETKYCPLTITSDNKGVYTWPQSLINNTVNIVCDSVNLSLNVSEQTATYRCSENGTWEDLNTASCQYVSEATKILQQFSKINTSIFESAELFKNYTSNVKIFQDVFDLIFATNTLWNYLSRLPTEQVGSILADVLNNILELPKSYIAEADRLGNVCSKLVNISETLAIVTSSPQLHKSNMALEEFSVNSDGFVGMKCTWYVNPDSKSDRLFYCVTNSQTETAIMKGKLVEASLTIPESLFQQIEPNSTTEIYKILIAMHAGNKLFPVDEEWRGVEDVTSAVVGVKLANYTVNNLTDPVVIMLKTPPSVAYELVPFTPVWWDQTSSNWSSDGCEFHYALQDHLVFTCRHFGYYGLLQDVSQMELAHIAAKFKFSPIGVYIGSTVLFVAFTIAILTYLLCYDAIQMPKKAKHCLINLWASIVCLCFMYVFGVYQTEDVRLCRIIGVSIHYFTLASVLWMCAAVNSMYKRLSKNNAKAVELHDDELPSSPDQPIKKPILGLYLVGWGVGSIVCGITAAINVNDYSAATYCFLKLGPPLTALYIPFVVLAIFIVVYCLLVRCAIYDADANGHLSEGTQATENVDLDLLEPAFENCRNSVRSLSTRSSSSGTEDPEHSPIAQLKAHVIFSFVYVLTWLCAAFSASPPSPLRVFDGNEEEAFGWMFAVCATLLSLFTLFFYCVARNDVRDRWSAFCRLMRGKRCFRTRNVSDNSPRVPQIQMGPPAVHETTTIASRSSSRSSSNNKSRSYNGNALNVGPSFVDVHGTKNNVNLIALHRRQYRAHHGIPNIIENPTEVADVFYNPHQSTVARKFFKRQKRRMTKRTNLTSAVTAATQRNDDVVSSISSDRPGRPGSDRNLFGTSSKVNNTNIHVEYVGKSRDKNPNIFSDSTDDFSVDDFVKSAERARRETTKQRFRKRIDEIEPPPDLENEMRSVSQQCTLEYSSENMSDSILDKTSPDKLLPQRSTQQDDPTYCRIKDLISDASSDLVGGKRDEGAVGFRRAPGRGRISRASSVSASDLDELYQQIRSGGPRMKYSTSQGRVKLCKSRRSPCLSDSEVSSSYVKYMRCRYRDRNGPDDNVETTV